MAVTVEQVKCACADCVCIVPVGSAIEAEGRSFCSDSCAQHHAGGTGCDHAGCTCHG
ncbi:metallothionein [Sphingomonas sp.]|uniref:metallothionein n=1 Tax=Sphingomonas sp. TaxID=28214 RepID=UPI0031CE4A35